MKTSEMINKEQQAEILKAIGTAERNTSGEIRVHIEKKCPVDVLDRAAFIFKKLKMHNTQLRNGVLFYLALEDRKFAILGDAGINAKVQENFWDEIKNVLAGHFQNSDFAGGLSKGIIMAGEQLTTFFPIQPDDVNELSDDISFG